MWRASRRAEEPDRNQAADPQAAPGSQARRAERGRPPGNFPRTAPPDTASPSAGDTEHLDELGRRELDPHLLAQLRELQAWASRDAAGGATGGPAPIAAAPAPRDGGAPRPSWAAIALALLVALGCCLLALFSPMRHLGRGPSQQASPPHTAVPHGEQVSQLRPPSQPAQQAEPSPAPQPGVASPPPQPAPAAPMVPPPQPSQTLPSTPGPPGPAAPASRPRGAAAGGTRLAPSRPARPSLAPFRSSSPGRRGQLLRPGPGIHPPVLLNLPSIRSESVRRRRAQGGRPAANAGSHHARARIRLAVLVDERGHVVTAKMRGSDTSEAALDRLALQGALAARYRPATRNGVPGRMWTALTFEFDP